MPLNIGRDVCKSPRVLVTLRVILVLVGGYALAAALSLIIAQFSSAEGRELRSLIYLVFFIAYSALIIWWFAINSHRKTWLVAGLGNVVAWSLLWALGGLA